MTMPKLSESAMQVIITKLEKETACQSKALQEIEDYAKMSPHDCPACENILYIINKVREV